MGEDLYVWASPFGLPILGDDCRDERRRGDGCRYGQPGGDGWGDGAMFAYGSGYGLGSGCGNGSYSGARGDGYSRDHTL
jgi:hypothetical protein